MSYLASISALIRQRFLRSSGIIIIAAYYSLLLLPMQYSRHSWAIPHLDRTWDIIPLLHSELSLLLIITTFLVVFVPSFVTSISILSAYYYLSLVNFIVWHSISRPFHPADIKRVVELVIFYPAFASLNNTMIAGIVFFVVTPVPIALLLLYLWHKAVRRFKTLKNCLVYGYISILMFSMLFFPLTGSAFYFQENSLVRMLREIGYEYDLKHMPVDQRDLESFFGQPMQGDRVARKQGPHGKMNIILFVLETAPFKYYNDEINQFVHELHHTYPGNTVSLREHYTTYPESNRAVLSILTGRYPSLERGSTWIETCDFSSALPEFLKKYGYATYLLSTAPLDYQEDRAMMKNLGFDHIVERGRSGTAGMNENGKSQYDPGSLYQADQDMLHDALGIISSRLSGNYLLVLLPRASHSPFQAPPDYSGDGSQESLIRANGRWQLSLIKEIMGQVAERNQMDRTCFIITGDHGLRHPSESSLFSEDEVDWLSPLTFQVPFIRCSPKVLSNMKEMATSHIDITPTILEMNGLRYEADRYHGRSMFRDVQRMIFFLGGECLPVYGIKKDNMFFMENRNRNLILKCPSMEFMATAQKLGTEPLLCSEVDRARVSCSLNIMKSYLFHPRTSPPDVQQPAQ